MAPTIPSLAQSESKAKFFDRLSMRTDNMKDKRVYSAMKREAADARRRLIASHEPDESISETAMHREILEIYQRASPQTKPIYDLGHDRDGVEVENWIIRWLVWHAFRYRDQRNNRIRRLNMRSGDEDDDREYEMDSSEPPSIPEQNGSPVLEAGRQDGFVPRGRRFYDPVRDS